jgi:ribose transport system ATP-binding protein
VFANGSNIWNGSHETANEEKLVSLLSGEALLSGTGKRARHAVKEKNEAVFVKLKGFKTKTLHTIDFTAVGNEIIGVAGLEGSGQVDFLKEIFLNSQAGKDPLASKGKISYVTGDRKKEGIFPGWSILHNINMTAISRFRLFSPLKAGSLRQKASRLFDKLGIIGESIDAGIDSLSGGNQQKTLVARALADDSDILILNDLTRGVDIATKKQIYGLLREAADAGKLIIWYSSDDEELELCSRVLVFRYGHIVRVLENDEITKKNIIKTSFEGENLINRDSIEGHRKLGFLLKSSIPLAAMVIVFGVSAILQHEVLSRFGIDLLIGGAVPLIFATYAQMYILGLSHVDLSVGAFMGLINVLCATWLHDSPPLGALAIVVAIALYACMGLVIYYRKVPAIIVTLGMSFVWLGMAYTIQARPGGEAPMWLVNIFDVSVPLIPLSVLLAIGGALVSYLVYRSRYGTVIRGFGNNISSMERSGWSNMRAYFLTYLLAAMFVTFGGFTITAQSFASDANATASYTLLTIASVVVGGGSLLGGIVSPFGALFGALTLSMIGALLGFLNINSDYVTMVQGLLLLSALALRLLRKEARI